MKRMWESKTVWLGGAITLAGLFLDPEFQKYAFSVIPSDLQGYVVGVAGILVMVLRTYFTDQAIGKE